ncbi:MAG TPA: hypothetical protein VLW55_09860 [Burkholderiaceae bacterium]|nr:hypothetical protein [Burkholderiaceae bacterium]
MRALWLIALLAAAPVAAADEDAAALGLADKTVAPAEQARDWHAFAEAAWNVAALRNSDTMQQFERLSLGLSLDKRFAPDWRAVIADRIDAWWQQEPSRQYNVNTLQEAYVSWQPRPDRIADLGSVNTRYGVAYAYNPTDFFRTDAVRSTVSADPSVQRENRLGTVAARGQALWTGGSLTGLYSPKLADRPNNSAFDPDFGATNGTNRWLVAGSQRLSDQFDPQLLLFGTVGEPPQFGLNLTALLNDATVLGLEWSGGRSSSLLVQALLLPPDTAFRSRLAVNLTYTTSSKLSLTTEYEYNGAALDRDTWDELGRKSLTAYIRYRTYVAGVQDPPTRHRVFLRAFWQDALVNHFDLTSNAFIDAVDHSWQLWIEGRYHWTRLDVALQWQRNEGTPLSQYGALPQQWITQALARYFF